MKQTLSMPIVDAVSFARFSLVSEIVISAEGRALAKSFMMTEPMWPQPMVRIFSF
jgi:hypothetical protein